MVPQGKPVDDTIAKLEPLLNKGDILIDGGNSNYKDSQRRYTEVTAEGISVCRCGHLGRRVGTERGLQHDDRRRQGAGRVSASDLRDAGSGQGQGLGTCGPGGRRALRQDDPQRHRVRHDAGLCRGLYDHGEERRAESGPAADLADLALRQRGAQLAARSDRRCAWQESDAEGLEPTWRTRARAAGRCSRRSI